MCTDDGIGSLGVTGPPLPHAPTHQAGGSDPIKLDDLAQPDDNTDLNVSTTRHGLAPKLPNNATQYLDGTGAFSTPPGSVATAVILAPATSARNLITPIGDFTALTLRAGTASPTTSSFQIQKSTSAVLIDVSKDGNLGIGTATDYGSGIGVLSIAPPTTAPTTNPTTALIVYVGSDNKLKIRDSSGTIVSIEVDASAANGSLRTIGTGPLQAAAGDHTHTVFTNLTVTHLTAGGSTPGIAAGPGAGAATGGAAVIAGTDEWGLITVTTGTSPSTNAIMCTITFAAPWVSAPQSIVLQPANRITADFAALSPVYVDSTTITTAIFNIKTSLSATPPASSIFSWYYMVGG